MSRLLLFFLILIPLCISAQVQDTLKPQLSFKADSFTLEVLKPYSDPPYELTDNADSTPHLVRLDSVRMDTLHHQLVSYVAIDSSGNVSDTAQVWISIEDNTPPVISLVGNQAIYVQKKVCYCDKGYIIDDNYWQAIRVDTISTLTSTCWPGLFIIYYIATDGSGNVAHSQQRILYFPENEEWCSGIGCGPEQTPIACCEQIGLGSIKEWDAQIILSGNVLTAQFPQAVNQYHLQLFSASGKVIPIQIQQAAPDKLQIQLPDLPSGAYVLAGMADGKVITHKLVLP